MAKKQTIYVCTKCDHQTSGWQGKCPECNNWGTLEQIFLSDLTQEKEITKSGRIINFNDIKGEYIKRIDTGIKEFNRVLGGGIVPGSLTLIGGEPGIGKSTLVLQVSGLIEKTLYVSGEESAEQIKMRLDRLNIKSTDILFSPDIKVEKVCATIEEVKPSLVIIDSIQTIYSGEIPNEMGSTTQIRACTAKLLESAKTNKIPIFIIGHITKDGQVAGPKTLEHLVDTVVYIEGEEKNDFRILKTKKNRFGATSEIGIFEMKEDGLHEINNPSGIFLEENNINIAGVSISSIIEGTRSFLIEIQSLTSKTLFGYPQRRAFGFDLNRLQILVTVLTKKAKINLTDQDININIVGGIKTKEPAVDLAICLSIVSAYKDKPLPKNTIVVGEVGLGGEIRKVNKIEQRIKEAKMLGFTKIIMPNHILKNEIKDIELIKVDNLSEAISILFK